MMTKPLKLHLPLSVFEDLHEAADGRGVFCKVSKKDLRALLMDHSVVLAKLADIHLETEEDYAVCDQVRQARG
jgi:hypothetical protein